MATKTEQEWKVTISITRTLRYPIEDNEGIEEFKKWAKTPEGRELIQQNFIKRLKCYGYPLNADIEIVDIESADVVKEG